jgi:O-acetylserine/cysteine efflux transporter
MVRRLVSLDGVTLIAWVAVFATPQLFAMSYVIEGAPGPYIASADWIVWGTVVYLGLIMTALGYTMWYTLIRRHPVGQVAPFLLLLPVFSVIGGITLLGEQLTLRIALGGAVVIAGVAFILFERAPAAADQTQAPARADDTETLPPRKPGLRTSPADRPGG